MAGDGPYPKDPEELLTHFLEGETDAAEQALVEEYLRAHPEARFDVVLYRGLMDRMAALPGETAPPDFAARVLAEAPAVPGSFMHRVEVALGRLFLPSMVAATVLGGLFAFSLLPQGGPGPVGPGAGLESPSAFALLETGPSGALLPHETLRGGSRKALATGQVVQIAMGSPALLKFPGGVVAKLQDGTRFSIGPREIRLLQGKVRVSVRPGVGDFAVYGPEASAHVIGTEFEVEAGSDGTSVAVVEGKVEVRAPGAQPVRLTAGERASASRRNPGVLERGHAVAAAAAQPVQPSGSPEGVPGLDSK